MKILEGGELIVELGGGKSGMIHISKLSDKRIARVEDVVNTGDKVHVKVIQVDNEKGRIGLQKIYKKYVQNKNMDASIEFFKLFIEIGLVIFFWWLVTAIFIIAVDGIRWTNKIFKKKNLKNILKNKEKYSIK